MSAAPAPASGGRTAAGSGAIFDTSAHWRLSSKVAVRPEPFGALLYDFRTRKLSFLKNLVIVDLVTTMHTHPSVDAALRAAGVDAAQRGPYVSALASLAQSGMIVPASQ